MNLTSISSFCGTPNLPGLITIQYTPLVWVYETEFERIISPGGNWQYNVVFTQGDWLNLPILPKGRLWNEQPDNSAQGISYRQEVAGITPKLRPAVTHQFQKMEKVPFILQIKDKNGQPWIMGDFDHPFYFLARAGIGDESGNNNYSISFTSQSRYRAAGYVPVLP